MLYYIDTSSFLSILIIFFSSFDGEQPATCVEAPPPYVGNVVVYGSGPF